MDWIQIILLSLIQGLTEFLPVSSSAHLVLPAQLTQWPDQGLAFDVAVHFGTLIAVLTYFRTDLLNLLSAAGRAPMMLRTNGWLSLFSQTGCRYGPRFAAEAVVGHPAYRGGRPGRQGRC